MNDDNQFSLVGDEAMEARIIAWVLEEASPFEADELERICQEQPKWAAFKRRIMQLHGLLADASKPVEEEWSLPVEKRAAVESVLHSHAPKHRPHSVAWWRMPSVQAAAASVGILGVAGALLLPSILGKNASRSPLAASAMKESAEEMPALSAPQTETARMSKRQREMPGARGMVLERDAFAAPATSAPASAPAKAAETSVTAGIRSGDGAITRDSIDAVINNPNRASLVFSDEESLAQDVKDERRTDAPAQSLGGASGGGMGPGVGSGAKAYSSTLDRAGADGAEIAAAKQQAEAAQEAADPFASADAGSGVSLKARPALEGKKMEHHSEYQPPAEGLAAADAAPAPSVAPKAEPIDDVRRNLYHAEGNYNLGKYDEARKAYQDVLRVDPHNAAARRGMEQANQAKRDYYKAAYDESRSALLSEVEQVREEAVPEAGRSVLVKPAEKGDFKPAGVPLVGKLFANEGELAQLDKALRDQEVVVEEKRKELEQIARSKNFIYDSDKSISSNSESASSTGISASAAAQSFVELEKEKVELQSQVNNLQNYGGEQLMGYAASLDVPDNAIKQLHPQYLAAQRELQKLQSQGLTESDSAVKEKKAQLAETKKKLDGETVQLRATLKAQLEMANDRLAKADALSKDREGDLLKRSLDQREFVNAKEGYEDSVKLLERMRQKHQQMKRQAEPAKPKPDVSKEISAEKEPFSTFSLHVSDASFRLAVAAMARGEWPAADRVRVEEFYNAFEYGDSAPSANEPVACVVEQAAHPYYPQRNLIRIGVRTGSSGRGAGVPLHLTVLLDNSGSMERDDRRESVRAALVQLSSLLGENDTITLVGFAREPRLVADRLNGAKASEIVGAAMRMPAEGGTNLEQALTLGEELAKRQFAPGAQNRIVLLTDGAANLGNAKPEDLSKKIEELRQQGIAFDAAGIGAEGVNDKMLEALTRKGDGRYYIVRNPEDADAGFAKKLAGAFRPAAENVKVQVRWNPRRVKSYLLNGFEEHRLNKEDFRNDAVDAAEMAAEEAGQALYQAAILPEGEGELGEVSVRFHDAASGKMVERTWTIPYAPSTPAFDRAAPSMQLAGLALMTAEKLRGGPLAAAIEMANFTTTTANVRAHYANDKRIAELIEMIGKLK